MRTLVLALVLAAPLPLSAQLQWPHGSPHARMPQAGETVCGQVFLSEDRVIFGHRDVTFAYGPAAAGAPSTVLEGPAPEPETAPGERGVWWAVGTDSVAAYLPGTEETVWELRIGHGETMLTGTLRRVIPPGASEVARAFAALAPCEEDPPGR